MSHAYETLRVRLERLEEWISETERVAVIATDPVTRQQIQDELARWRESRAACSAFLVRMKWLNRGATTAMTLLLISFGGMVVFALFGPPQSGFISALLGLDYLVLLASTISYLIIIMLRDSVARGGEPWRFSMRSTLIVMTVIALILGSLAWVARR